MISSTQNYKVKRTPSEVILEYLYEHKKSSIEDISQGTNYPDAQVAITLNKLKLILKEDMDERTPSHFVKVYSVDQEKVKSMYTILPLIPPQYREQKHVPNKEEYTRKRKTERKIQEQKDRIKRPPRRIGVPKR